MGSGGCSGEIANHTRAEKRDHLAWLRHVLTSVASNPLAKGIGHTGLHSVHTYTLLHSVALANQTVLPCCLPSNPQAEGIGPTGLHGVRSPCLFVARMALFDHANHRFLGNVLGVRPKGTAKKDSVRVQCSVHVGFPACDQWACTLGPTHPAHITLLCVCRCGTLTQTRRASTCAATACSQTRALARA